jgi:DNA replication and repair protein RecF
MRLKEIQLTNFRNYASQRIKPAEGMNILVGQNAQGKSNLLEAIYVLATTKSHRTNRDSDLIRIGEETTRLVGEVIREKQNDVSIEIILSRSEKKMVRVNTVRHSRIADAIGQLNSVVFSAEDLAMIKGEPSERRRFLNLEVSQVSGQYCYALGGYRRALQQRNALLKTMKAQRGLGDTLSAWDEQLIDYGSIMIKGRMDFINRLGSMASPIHGRLTNGSESLDIEYEPSFSTGDVESVDDIKTEFRNVLARIRDHELARGTSLKGPHRDDLGFQVNGLDARYFGSQGQQRTVALAVKLAEVQLVEEMVGEPPVALLDDVMAELDEERRSHVFDLIFGKCQIFAAATSREEFTNDVLAGSVVFGVRNGELTPQ